MSCMKCGFVVDCRRSDEVRREYPNADSDCQWKLDLLKKITVTKSMAKPEFQTTKLLNKTEEWTRRNKNLNRLEMRCDGEDLTMSE